MSQKISQQDPVVTIADDDVFTLVQDSSGLNKKITGADLKAQFGSRYNKYVALCSQASTGAPTVTILENSIGDIVWTRNSTGDYRGTLAAAFTADKTALIISVNGAVSGLVHSYSLDRIDVNTVRIRSGWGGALSDDLLVGATIEIRVYP